MLSEETCQLLSQGKNTVSEKKALCGVINVRDNQTTQFLSYFHPY